MEGVAVTRDRAPGATGAQAQAAGAPADGVSKAQRAHAYLRERIESGAYSPGYRLVLGQIARELGVSPVPVREAVRMLEAEGLVTYERNVGAQVAMPNPELYATTMETLGVVEGYATAIAMPSMTADRIAESRAINERLKRTLDDFDPTTFTQLNEAFHESLFRDCPNDHILDLVERGWRRVQGMRDSIFDFVPGRASASVREHDAILDLIEQGAPAAEVERAARDHRHNTLDAYLEFRRNSTPPPHDPTEGKRS